jgi:hypothetical protein
VINIFEIEGYVVNVLSRKCFNVAMTQPQLFLTILLLMLLTGWSPLPVRVDSKCRPMNNPGLILFQQVRVFIFPGSANIGDTYFGFSGDLQGFRSAPAIWNGVLTFFCCIVIASKTV